MPRRAKIVKEQLVAAPPIARKAWGHGAPGGSSQGQAPVLQAQKSGGSHRGTDQGNNIQWGAHSILNTGPEGHKLQWYK
eukprot:492194-Karenia_brevis.AAC.1